MISKFEKKTFHQFVKLVETNILIYNTLQLDQYSRLAIRLNIFQFWAIYSKTKLKFEKVFRQFVVLVKTNPLIVNIKDLR